MDPIPFLFPIIHKSRPCWLQAVVLIVVIICRIVEYRRAGSWRTTVSRLGFPKILRGEKEGGQGGEEEKLREDQYQK